MAGHGCPAKFKRSAVELKVSALAKIRRQELRWTATRRRRLAAGLDSASECSRADTLEGKNECAP